ncbi:MAG: hypothetical protein H6Q13_3228 [Bacteroidetes bacterium]|jgi:hypothetical protein|nr:hypothetical protein [Bacteroidota bacterium]
MVKEAILEEMKIRNMSIGGLALRSGINVNTLKSALTKNSTHNLGIKNVERIFNALDLKIVRNMTYEDLVYNSLKQQPPK